MESLQDLIEEVKVRTVYWALCIFAMTYFLSNTSKSIWMNLPISILLVAALRILFSEVEFRWKVRKVRQRTYLSHLEKKQLSVNDSRLSTLPPPPKWKSKIDSPLVEAAMEDFISKILKDFVVDLWYSDITPDKEAPELIHAVIMDALGEISERVKELNLVDLLTRDIVDLVGVHFDLFRRNQAAIGVDVMGTLSSEARDERLKHHLMTTKELHPALVSPECEYKVMQRFIGGLLAIVLRPREAQCPLVRCIARELVTCLVMQPVMNFASPGYINELIEYVLIATKGDGSNEVGTDQSPNVVKNHDQDVAADRVQHDESTSARNAPSSNQGTDMPLSRPVIQGEKSIDASGNLVSDTTSEEHMHARPADWARVLEAATQRRKEVLMPENLENMWTKGRNYKKKAKKNTPSRHPAPGAKGSVVNSAGSMHATSTANEERAIAQFLPGVGPDKQRSGNYDMVHLLKDLKMEPLSEGGCPVDGLKDPTGFAAIGNRSLRRSNSTSSLNVEPNVGKTFATEGGGPIISDFYSPNFGGDKEVRSIKSASEMVYRSEGLHAPKLRCRVIGAYFEKLGSNSFAVYSIAVTDADKKTWFVKRRYRNFERLHRHLKDIPNYTLHLPPKRIFSSSTEDAFVHQRCIQLDKYLQDLLSIANVAEQHEVWDFLSVSSKNYSFGKSSSVMRTLAVNVDDAVDDIVRQFKGVFGSSSSSYEASPSISGRNLSWNADEITKHLSLQDSMGSAKSFSDNEEGDKDETHHGHDELGSEGSGAHANGWHSDNELNSKGFPPRVVKRDLEIRSLDSEKKHEAEVKLKSSSLGRYPMSSLPMSSDQLEDPVGVPPEWTPPNLSVPMLNLVDNIFQLKRRGWLRRQVFWMSKQILQLMMEDAIDDWLLRQIRWLRRDDVIAQGIRWVQDVLWPEGTFFLKLRIGNDDNQSNQGSSQHSDGRKVCKPGSFEQQLEASRRASDIKKMLLNGAPTTLVSLIGHKQYKRCAKDIYYFLQSTICLKQLAYAILELVLVSVFPEMRDLLLDVHEKMQGSTSVAS